ncbi:MAG: cysteine desulfurase family protein [Planctomycetota bacterium]|jgi:cysteine desulfurase
MERIYLDYNATAPVLPEVVAAMMPALTGHFGNPSNVHHFGREAADLLDTARHQVAALLGAELDEIIFTSGGTEANNLALAGVLHVNPSRRNHLITTAVEHSSVFEMAEYLERTGFDVTYLPVDETGRIDPQALQSEIRETTALVSVILANNEIGTVQDMAAIQAITREAGVPLHTDAVQAVGKLPIDVGELGVSLLSLSGHKFGAPKGVGALYLRRGTRLQPTALGGKQETGRRAGTENVPGIAGLGKAAERTKSNLEENRTAMESTRAALVEALTTAFPKALFNGDADHRTPNTVNVTLPGLDADALVIQLDLAGIAVSTGSACSSGTKAGSRILEVIGRSAIEQHSTLRFSVGPDTTTAEIRSAVQSLTEIAQRTTKP